MYPASLAFSLPGEHIQSSQHLTRLPAKRHCQHHSARATAIRSSWNHTCSMCTPSLMKLFTVATEMLSMSRICNTGRGHNKATVDPGAGNGASRTLQVQVSASTYITTVSGNPPSSCLHRHRAVRQQCTGKISIHTKLKLKEEKKMGPPGVYS